MVKTFTHTTDKLFLPSLEDQQSLFSQRYIALRTKEHRVFTDEELLNLPATPKNHPHHTEWLIRKRSAKRLVHYLEEKKRMLNLLEVGCGNGWLCRQLAGIPGSMVTGNDIGFPELQQAARVFSHVPQLNFTYGDIRSGVADDNEYDFIIFAASIQYFSPLPELIRKCVSLLKPQGELHIFDSPFYQQANQAAAIARTNEYYHMLGFPGMSSYFFHHTIQDLAAFNYTILYQPTSLQHYLVKNKNPFPWIALSKEDNPL